MALASLSRAVAEQTQLESRGSSRQIRLVIRPIRCSPSFLASSGETPF